MNRAGQITTALNRVRVHDLRASLTVICLLICTFAVVLLSTGLEALNANVSGVVDTLGSQ